MVGFCLYAVKFRSYQEAMERQKLASRRLKMKGGVSF